MLEYQGGGGSDAKTETIALVGKGIVYDTGGLALKSKTGMCLYVHDGTDTAVFSILTMINNSTTTYSSNIFDLLVLIFVF